MLCPGCLSGGRDSCLLTGIVHHATLGQWGSPVECDHPEELRQYLAWRSYSGEETPPRTSPSRGRKTSQGLLTSNPPVFPPSVSHATTGHRDGLKWASGEDEESALSHALAFAFLFQGCSQSVRTWMRAFVQSLLAARCCTLDKARKTCCGSAVPQRSGGGRGLHLGTHG